MFCSRSFMALSLTFKPLIHFEFVLVCGIRRWCSFIGFGFFWHVSVQYSQQHLLNSLSLPRCMFLPPCQILISIKVWVYFWAVYSVTLIYILGFMPEPCCFDYYGVVYNLISGRMISLTVFFFLKIAVAYWGSLNVPYKCLEYLF